MISLFNLLKPVKNKKRQDYGEMNTGHFQLTNDLFVNFIPWETSRFKLKTNETDDSGLKMEVHTIVLLGGYSLLTGIVRDYYGFGFSIIAITSQSLVLPPAKAVPVFFITGNLCQCIALTQVWR